MPNRLKKLFTSALKHKIISLIVIAAIIGGGYFWYKSVNGTAGKVSYITTPVQKGSIIVSVSGSGQVSPSNQMDLKSKVSENVIYVGVKNGQHVGAGTLLMEFDTANAQKAVRNAQINLDNAKLSLQKLAGDGSAIIPLNKQQAQDNLTETYSKGFNAVADTFLDLPGIMSGLDEALFGEELNKSSQNISYYRDYINIYNNKGSQYADSAYDSYQKAKTSYDKNFADYKLISRSSDTNTIDAIINETYQTTQDISDSIKNANNLIQFYKDIFTVQKIIINPVSDTQLATLNTYTGKINTSLSNLLNIQSTIKSDKTAVSNSDLDLQSQNLSLKQAENALADAKDNLANCYIYAPFGGIVANVVFKVHDNASSGATAITFITNQSITEIPFNEVDITKIKAGQKATLAFDAINGLTIVGQVADIDTLGTVAQGVVNYNVKIIFDANQTLVKPGMSVTADVITDVKQDVLIVPNSAVKTSGALKYVQMLVNGLPEQRVVQTGISNDTETEITSGLQEGENIITQTINASAASTAAQGTSSIRIPGITGGSGGGGGGSGFGGGGGTRNTTGR